MEYPLDNKSEGEVAKQLGIPENAVIQSLIRLWLCYGFY